MATLIKKNARKLLQGGPIGVGYGNLNMPGLLEKKHIILDCGDYILRENLERATKLAYDILEAVAECKKL